MWRKSRISDLRPFKPVKNLGKPQDFIRQPRFALQHPMRRAELPRTTKSGYPNREECRQKSIRRKQAKALTRVGAKAPLRAGRLPGRFRRPPFAGTGETNSALCQFLTIR